MLLITYQQRTHFNYRQIQRIQQLRFYAHHATHTMNELFGSSHNLLQPTSLLWQRVLSVAL